MTLSRSFAKRACLKACDDSPGVNSANWGRQFAVSDVLNWC
eukprot:CAMPEP_0204037092 /NCGR_PEP_ID=MMETSP0360-20130528/82160_1 /ASSEMBLY_ACC=CAM_ASM_000342 /TAXON_ID=268821 /ORGANISM="Scrippsiella Hangoei, Strain SHTV-5" /LENGTH=40 /DNA_ID= /DNA_START= /DNA_END= /DNA_ORIENTATION=